MLTMPEALTPLAERRTDEVVVTTMSSVRLWGRLSGHPLDFASADSAMGHAADLALGIAMAQPDRRVLCLNGDGSMLMTLGTLVTIVASGVRNLALVVMNNRQYEITGGQPMPGAGTVDYARMAAAAGFAQVFSVAETEDYGGAVEALFTAPGPVFAELGVEPGTEGPIARGPGEEAHYLKRSLYDSARALRRALAIGPKPAGPSLSPEDTPS